MRRVLALLLAAIGVAVVVACGTDATGIETCRKVETARCEAAPACNVSLASPPHPSGDVQGCIDFYHDACLHGLEVDDPGGPSADACVKAIQGASANNHCEYVLHPELATECAWLLPAAPVDDAGTDADADDGASVDDDASDADTD